jgi:hypothetical protein
MRQTLHEAVSAAHLEALDLVAAAIPIISGQCHEWPGWCGPYGRVTVRGFQFVAHRLAWENASGLEIPPGMLICHHCDNPPCIRGEHLFLGTKRDNAVDAQRKGRLFPLPVRRGEAHLMAKLKESDVEQIRDLFDSGRFSKLRLARLYSVSWTAIDDLLHRRRWASVA